MGVIEWHDDDIDQGFCPECGRRLANLTVELKGYCDTHKWVWAEFESFLQDPDEEEEGEQ